MGRSLPWRSLPNLTVGLIVASVLVTVASNFGSSIDSLRPLFISEYAGSALPEVRSGQVWRLITPIFIHFGLLHLVFNMLWLWDLGGAVEYRQGIWRLGLLVVGTGALANFAEYLYSGPAFGGMSGVVYALLGYVWMQGRYDPRSGLGLHKQIVVMMLVWYVLCWTGLLGPIANMAHTVGLAMGIGWGFLAAQIHRPRHRRGL